MHGRRARVVGQFLVAPRRWWTGHARPGKTQTGDQAHRPAARDDDTVLRHAHLPQLSRARVAAYFEPLHQRAPGDGDRARGGRRVAATADEARHACRDHGAHGGRIAVRDGRQSGCPCCRPAARARMAIIGVAPFREDARRETVDARVLLPVAAAMASSRREPAQRRQMRDRVHHAQWHDPAAGRRVGRDQHAVEGIERKRAVEAQKCRAQVARRADLQRGPAFADHALEIAVRHGDGAAIDVERDVRRHPDDLREGGPQIGEEPGIEAPPVCMVVTKPCALWGGQWRCRARIPSGRRRRRNRPWPARRPRRPSRRKSLSFRPGSEDDGARENAHPARPVVAETALRGDGQRLDACGVRGAAGRVDLRGADRRGRPAMQVAFEKAHRLLPGRVVAEGDVHMAVDEAGGRGRRPPASITTSAASISRSPAAPMADIRPSSQRIASPSAKGARQSPLTMVSRLMIAVFIGAAPFSEARRRLRSRLRRCRPRARSGGRDWHRRR